MEYKCNVFLGRILLFYKGQYWDIRANEIISTRTVNVQYYLAHVGEYGNRKTSLLVGNSHSRVQDHGTSYQDLTFKWFGVKKHSWNCSYNFSLSMRLLQNKK